MSGPPVWTETFRVRAYEVGPGGAASPLALCDYLQEAASNHAAALGVETLPLPSGVGVWVLARLRLRVTRCPAWREAVAVETWPSAEDGLRVHRDFVLRGEASDEVGRATTEWLVLDVAKRRPARLPAAVLALRAHDAPRALDAAPAPEPPATPWAERTFWVRRGDLDQNSHANNVRFVEWALEAVPADFEAAHRFVGLDVTFRGEAVYGERVVSVVGPAGENTLSHRLTRERDGALLALARTSWHPG